MKASKEALEVSEAIVAARRYWREQGYELDGSTGDIAELASLLDAFAAKAVAAERENCARLVLSDEGEGDIDFIAQLIRARGGK